MGHCSLQLCLFGWLLFLNIHASLWGNLLNQGEQCAKVLLRGTGSSAVGINKGRRGK